MREAVAICAEARTASELRLATLQKEAARVFRRLMNDLCTGENPSETSALIWGGADGAFVEACLAAQSVAWPDEKTRLSVAENAVGLLDNCREYAGLLGHGTPARLLKELTELEPLIAKASAADASGVLESYGLLLSRLSQKSMLPWSDEASRAVDSLVKLLQRPDLLKKERAEAAQLLCLLAAAAPAAAEFQNLKEWLFAEMQASLSAAEAYLRAHESYAKLDGDDGLMQAFETVRSHRHREKRARDAREAAFRGRNGPTEAAAQSEA